MEENTAQQQVQQPPANTAGQQTNPNQQTVTQQVQQPPPSQGGQDGRDKGLFNNTWIFVLIGIILLLGAGVIAAWFYIIPSMTQQESTTRDVATQNNQPDRQQPQPVSTGGNSIEVNDQPITDDLTIQVERVEVSSNSFLTFYIFQAQEEGLPSLMIASTSILVPDVYENFEVPIFTRPDLVDKLQLSRIKAGGTIYATLHKDVDGNGVFEPTIDNVILKDSFGNEIREEFELRTGQENE